MKRYTHGLSAEKASRLPAPVVGGRAVRGRPGPGLFGPALLCLAGIAASLVSGTALAQTNQGFERTARAVAGGAELLTQPKLWIYETQLKKIRMVRMDVTDPKTGKKSREWIWYLVYRVVNRGLNRPQDSTDTTPANTDDKQPPEQFMPEFQLVTTDGATTKIYSDVVLPEVQAEIARREELQLRNPVEAVGPLLPETAEGEPDQYQDGVAIWRGIDPETDFFTVYLTGFSNGYQIVPGPDGDPIRQRRTIVQSFWRPGDEFEQDEIEMRFKDEIRWEYRLDPPRDNPLPIEKPAAASGDE